MGYMGTLVCINSRLQSWSQGDSDKDIDHDILVVP